MAHLRWLSHLVTVSAVRTNGVEGRHHQRPVARGSHDLRARSGPNFDNHGAFLTSLRKAGPLRRGRSQARVTQNSRRTVAARAGSWSIHQWPNPSRATVLAPARAAALA